VIRFSVIIPTRDRPERLARCLHSFCDLTYPAGAWEIVVVNDGGARSFSAITPQLRESLPLRLLDKPQGGPAAARNYGAAHAANDFLAFTDDDCRVPADWLTEFAAGLEQTGYDALGGRWRNPQPHNTAMQAAAYLIEFMYGFMRDTAGYPLLLVSNNAVYRRTAFVDAGGFDESFPLAAGEDLELGFRFASRDYRQGYWPNARVWHDHNLTGWGHVRQQFRYGRGGHFFVLAQKKLRQAGPVVQPAPAGNFYRALWHDLRGQNAPGDLIALIAAGQFAYRLGQFSQRQLSRLHTLKKMAQSVIGAG
jgi:GT2 family glycosyltransferase